MRYLRVSRALIRNAASVTICVINPRIIRGSVPQVVRAVIRAIAPPAAEFRSGAAHRFAVFINNVSRHPGSGPENAHGFIGVSTLPIKIPPEIPVPPE